MTSEASAVKCLSWNINGSFTNKIPILDVVFEQNEVVCLQEHFVTSRSKSILSFNSSVSVYSVSAKQLSGKGRPSGGIATFVRSTLRSSVFEVNDNFLAIRVEGCVFINVYLPTNYHDERSERAFTYSSDKLGQCINRIRSLSLQCILVGDFNCDLNEPLLSRSLRSTLLLSIFGDQFDLKCKDLNFTHVHTSMSTSDLDHVVASANLRISPVKVVLDFQLSDHLPIQFSAEIPCHSSDTQTQTTSKTPPRSRRDWRKINPVLFQEEAARVLSKIRVPFHLLSGLTALSREETQLSVDFYCAEIGHALRCAEKAAVPLSRPRHHTLPGWSENPELVDTHSKSKFWLQLWVSCGRPRSGVVNSIRLLTKRKFAKELKAHRKKMIDIESTRAKINPSLLWRFLSSKSDESLSASAIPDSEWYAYYGSEFSPPDPALNERYEAELDDFLDSCPRSDYLVTEGAVCRAISHLKPKQSFGIDGISALHLKSGGPALISHVTLLMQIILIQGIVPTTFSIGDLTPVPKKGKVTMQCSSFRPITVATTLCKLFELLFVDEFEKLCCSPPRQFGFQRGIGCAEALHVVAYALLDAHKSGESLAIGGLDLQRAFDSLIHALMLLNSAKRGVNSNIIRAFRDLYSRLRVRLKLPPDKGLPPAPRSALIPVRKGARQGAVLSPNFFNNYIIEPQDSCPSSCILSSIDISLVCYADDTLNLSRTLNRLSEIFSCLQSNYEKVGLRFNSQKSEVLLYNWKNDPPTNITLGDCSVKPVDKIVYLGLPIGSSLQHTRSLLISHLERRISSSYALIVKSTLRFNRPLLASIYNATALPHILYVTPFWKLLANREKSKIRSLFFRFAKYLLKLPPWTKNSFLIRRYNLADPNLAVETLISRQKTKPAILKHEWASLLV